MSQRPSRANAQVQGDASAPKAQGMENIRAREHESGIKQAHLFRELEDAGKFITLDTVLVALTCSAKRRPRPAHSQRQEKYAKEGKAMRVRQVLFLFDQYFPNTWGSREPVLAGDVRHVSRSGETISDLRRVQSKRVRE